jgi:phospholipid transport system substrate-binding protein
MRKFAIALLVSTFVAPAAFANPAITTIPGSDGRTPDFQHATPMPMPQANMQVHHGCLDHCSQNPTEFIDGIIHQALAALGNKQITDAAREELFRKMLDTDFDMPHISKFVVGHYWTEASDQDRQAFLSLFEAYIVHSYSARFKEFSDQKIKITGTAVRGDITEVQSQIIPDNDAPIELDWMVRTSNEPGYPLPIYKIADVNVEGVSLLLTEREEFISIIDRNGGTLAGLNQAIKQKLQQH